MAGVRWTSGRGSWRWKIFFFGHPPWPTRQPGNPAGYRINRVILSFWTRQGAGNPAGRWQETAPKRPTTKPSQGARKNVPGQMTDDR